MSKSHYLVIDPFVFQGLNPWKWLTPIKKKNKRNKYKYFLNRNISFILPEDFKNIEAKYNKISLSQGVLSLERGFLSDGASGIAIDGPGNILASIIHDALGRLKNYNKVKYSRKQSDKIYKNICLAQNTNIIRAWTHYFVIRIIGKPYRLWEIIRYGSKRKKD